MLANRPPIVVILGHVDHGKTSLLDAILKSNIANKEVGGITQSVRSFQTQDPKTTFVDTPGHAAFTAMRTRGGKIADIALLIVSGVDGVMPQTRESIDTIKSSKIPMIVVVTKKDLPDYNLDRIKTQLAEAGVLVEGFGGDIPIVAVSAKSGEGIPELMEMIGLVNDLNPCQAETSGTFTAVVLESRMDPKRGPVAVVIVKDGSMNVGQNLFLGSQECGKIKALTSTSGESLQTAPPSTPLEVLGLDRVVPVGEEISDIARQVTEATVEYEVAASTSKTLKIILKADVAGSLEAIIYSLDRLIQVVQSSTGEINESDVLAAQSTGSIIVGFNTKVNSSAAKLAENEKIKIYTFKIIYELLDKVHMLAHPELLEKTLGRAQILAEFNIDGVRVAGCKGLEGVLKKGDILRIMRGEAKIGETKFKSLKLAKTETTEVRAPAEFGAVFSPYVDFKLQDIIIALTINDG